MTGTLACVAPVRSSVNLKGGPLVLNGKTIDHVAADDFPGFLDAFREAVNGGELDAEIEAIESSTGTISSEAGSGTE